jgi:hypothetical protein
MKAREVIENATYGPTTIRIMGQAFDGAWAEVAGTFGSDPAASDAARLNLANAVLSVTTEDSRDVMTLKQKALVALAFVYGKHR